MASTTTADMVVSTNPSPTIVPSESSHGDNSPAPSVVSATTSASCQESKKKQAVTQGTVTKLVSKINKLLTDDSDNFDQVKTLLVTFDKSIDAYQDAYKEHLTCIKKEDTRKAAVEKFTSKMREFNKFHGKILNWIVEVEVELQDSMHSVSEISSHTSKHPKPTSSKAAQSTVSSRASRHSKPASSKTAHTSKHPKTISSKAAPSVVSSRASRHSKPASSKTAKSAVSSHASRHSSSTSSIATSTSSQVSSKLLNAKIVSAQLAAEKRVLEKSIDTENELRRTEMDLKKQQAMIALDVKLAKAAAAESVLREEVSSLTARSGPVRHTLPIIGNLPPGPGEDTRLDKTESPIVLQSSASVPVMLAGVSLPQPETERVLTTGTVDISRQVESSGNHMAMMSALRLPKLQPPRFSGDAKTFHTFVTAFESQIAAFAASDADRLHYLHQFVDGEAKDLIARCLHMSAGDGFAEAMRLLKRKYGDPYKISVSYIDRIVSWPPIKADDCTGLEKFAVFLRECQEATKRTSTLSSLSQTQNLQMIVHKLPSFLQNQWRDRAYKSRRKDQPCGFNELCSFIEEAAEAANDPVYSKEAINQCYKYAHSTLKSKSAFATATTEAYTDVKCIYCSQAHDLDDCQRFATLSDEDKRKSLSQERRCFGCYAKGHIALFCQQKRTCKKCSFKHPTAMHIDGYESKQSKTRLGKTESTQSGMCQTTRGANQAEVTMHSILPVRVRQRHSSTPVITYAFYDNGSSGCFMTENLKAQLQATNSDITLELRTMHGKTFVKSSIVRDLEVTDVKGCNPVLIEKTYTRAEIPIDHSHIPKPEILGELGCLPSKISIPKYMPDVEIGLLIGSSCAKALQPLEVCPTGENGPYAMLLRHGWTVNGPVKVSMHDGHLHATSCNRIQVDECASIKEVMWPDPQEFLNALESDFHGYSIGQQPNERGPSRDDLAFLKRADSATRFVDGHFEIPLPFGTDNPTMPNNRSQAVRRAQFQRKKMLKDKSYFNEYSTFIKNLTSNRYADRVHSSSTEHQDGAVWYLPHHGVLHPRKKKLRVVFDCAARFGGTSLNDQLIQGPDLTNSIKGVLTRFRDGPVAFSGDIETMFYQVRVPEDQRNYLRFVWWPEGDLNGKLEDYRMNVHLFGAASSPSIANYALRQTAKKSSPEIATVIISMWMIAPKQWTTSRQLCPW